MFYCRKFHGAELIANKREYLFKVNNECSIRDLEWVIKILSYILKYIIIDLFNTERLKKEQMFRKSVAWTVFNQHKNFTYNKIFYLST